MTSKREYLAQQTLFKGLDDYELDQLAAVTEELEYQDGAIVAYQRDVADALIMVKNGRLYGKTVERGIVTESRDYLPGDTIGLSWLFTPSIYPATIQAASGDNRPARLLVIHSGDFLHFLSQHQEAIDYLEPEYDYTDNLIAGFPEEIYAEALKIKAKRDRRSNTMNILSDELIEFNSRRSGYYLFVRLLPALLGLLILPLIPFFFISNQAPDSFLTNFQIICPSLIALFFLGLGIFQFLDWTNDYFIITNRRVIHREFNLRTFRVDIKIARIDQIQSVSIDKPTLLSNMLRYGTARITTASQYGVILFDHINQPTRVTTILERLTSQVRTVDASREQTLVRQSIEDYFQLQDPYQRIVAEGDENTTGADDEIEAGADDYDTSLWGRFYRRYQWRVEENETIIYRKHFLVALRAIAWPLLVAGIIALIAFLLNRFALVPGDFLYPLLMIIYFFVAIWMVWQVEDWRNDLFMLTDRLIIDIDRLPFGFGQSSKQAGLENIQNVRAYTPGLIHTIFNYGYVEVETAGVDSNIEFEDVPFPGVVQSDIFHQIEEFKRHQREREEARRHKAFAVLLDVFKQEEEQGRLPRRTPYPFSDDDEEEVAEDY